MRNYLWTFVLIGFCWCNSAANSDCWWTGCQQSSWKVVGCEQYEKIETEKKSCKGGHEFYCCSKAAETVVTVFPEPVGANVKPIESNVIKATNTTQISPPSNCWWTGCQSNKWKVIGCEQYEKIEKDKKACEGGNEYYCCSNSTADTPKTDSRQETIENVDEPEGGIMEADCWWTGCHSKLWEVVGCEQYGKVEAGKKECEGGNEFYCCKTSNAQPQRDRLPIEKSESPVTSTSSTTFEEATPALGCWWTGCQNHTLAARGCEQFGRMATNTRTCEGGDEYFCCSEGEEDLASIAAVAHLAKCWWTGCQAYSLAARGCRPFGKVKENERPCDGGDEYFCCPKKDLTPITTEKPEPVVESQILGNCWWTGCQPLSLVAPGCDPFNRTEAEKKPCKGGNKYFCCLDEDEEEITEIPLQ